MDRRIEFIRNYDFTFLAKRLEKRGLSAADAAASISDMRELMIVIARNPDQPLSAWGRVEESLHEFVLDTRQYRTFCTIAFGGTLDHVPEVFGTDPFRAAWANSVRLMGDAGVVLNPDPDAHEGAANAAGCMIILTPLADDNTLSAAA